MSLGADTFSCMEMNVQAPARPNARPIRRPTRQEWEVAMRMIQVEDSDVIQERVLSEVLGMPRSTLLRAVPGLEGMGFVQVRPGASGLYGEARPSLFSWDPAQLREWLGGWCSVGQESLPMVLLPGSTEELKDNRHSWPTQHHHPICQPRWSPNRLGTLGWQIATVAQDWDRPFGVREMAREISRRWEHGADHAMVLRCLTKMARADWILEATATKADGRWTVKVRPLFSEDQLADEISKRHSREWGAHRQPSAPSKLAERPAGFLRGAEWARWAWQAQRAGGATTAPSQAKPADLMPEPLSPAEVAELERNIRRLRDYGPVERPECPAGFLRGAEGARWALRDQRAAAPVRADPVQEPLDSAELDKKIRRLLAFVPVYP